MRRLAGLVLLVMACGENDAPPASPTLIAKMGGTSMADTPWPSDVFLKNGRLEVGAIPLEGKKGPIDAIAATFAETDGAPIYGSVFFPLEGEVRDGSFEGRARWVDLDAGNREFETKLWSRALTSELVALPPKDQILAAGHRYAVVIESPELGPSPPMRAEIEKLGALATNASAVTVFTVGHPTALVDRMREVVTALPAPAAKVTKVLRGVDLEALTGKPATTRPGFGDGAGIVHDQIDTIVLGTFDAPSFLTDAPPRLGRIEVDDNGAPKVKGTEAIPYLLTLPKKPAAGWGTVPVLVFQHGLNANRLQVLTCADDYARAGFATIGIDALWHGERAANPKDLVNNITRSAPPDGLADPDDFGASISLFDFDGDDARGIAPFDSRYVRDNWRQAIVDIVMFGRFLGHGDHAAIAAADPELAGLAFDRDHVVYTSESFGSVIGASGIAMSDDFAGAVLSVGGGGIFLPIFPSSPTFTGVLTPFIKTSFDPYLDTSDPAVLPGEAQRVLSLLGAMILPGDPLAFAPIALERRRNVLLLEARSDELIPNQGTELMMKAMGATFVALPASSEPPRFVTLPTANAPYRAPSGQPTIALVQISPALHTMFTSFQGERRYQPEFPPFVSLPAPELVSNPIERVHDIAIDFAKSLQSGGNGEVPAR